MPQDFLRGQLEAARPRSRGHAWGVRPALASGQQELPDPTWQQMAFFCLFPPGFQYMNKESYLKTTTTTVPAPPNPHLRGIVSPQDR